MATRDARIDVTRFCRRPANRSIVSEPYFKNPSLVDEITYDGTMQESDLHLAKVTEAQENSPNICQRLRGHHFHNRLLLSLRRCIQSRERLINGPEAEGS